MTRALRLSLAVLTAMMFVAPLPRAAAQERLSSRPAGESKDGASKGQQPPVIEVEPPEEDEASKPREYAFNPLQAEKEFRIGNFYWKKKSYRAAAMRYEEATKWNPGYAEAWFRLGEAHERMKQPGEARAAYEEFLSLASDDKRAGEVKKRVARLAPSKKES